jgi:hypothetical protein
LTTETPLPPAALKFLEELLKERRSGSFILDVKDGRVIGWRTVAGRGERSGKYVS